MKKFDRYSTADDVLAGLDLRKKRVLITGVSSEGLGVETARALVARGATVVGTARDLAKANGVTEPVRRAAAQGEGRFRLITLDLSDLGSVRSACDQLVADGEPVDVVVANAGVMATPFGKTKDGFEQQFGVNVLGHYVLINRVAPLMGEGARLVVLSSNSHRFADVDLDDPNFEHTAYEPWNAYSRSKTGEALLAVAFDERFRTRGIRAASVHPGIISTELTRHLDPKDTQKMLKSMMEEDAAKGRPVFEAKSIPQGAATTVWAGLAADPELIGGKYCEDCAVAEVLPEGAEVSPLGGGVRSYALDPAHAEALWAKAGELVGSFL